MRAPLLVGLASLLVACKPNAAVTTADPAATAPASSASSVATSEPAPSASSAPAADVPSAKDSAMSANDFSFRFYAKARPAKGNALVSGTSLRAALGVAYLGARGETAKQMSSALALGAPEAAAEELKREAAAWDAARGSNELAIANRLWVEKKYPFLPAFVELAKRAGAPAEPLDFSASEPARKTMNAWVSDRTKTKIPDILPEGSITPLTRFVATNAIYFKASWAHAFKPAATRDDPFTTGEGKVENVKTMHQVSTFRVGRLGDSAGVVELPYAGSTLAMDVVLPDKGKALDAIEGSLSAADLGTWTSALSPSQIDLALPKFTFRSGGTVKEPLQAMGITDAFGDASDFTGISAPKDLYLSDVFHKTFIAVDEQGTEAAAASAVVGASRGLGGPPPPTPFKVDRPFLFLIRDTKSGNVLFIGRVTNPKAS